LGVRTNGYAAENQSNDEYAGGQYSLIRFGKI
jgi:hypothetical protein